MHVGVVGLGKLGAPIAACFASGHDVVCCDVRPSVVDKINAGEAPVDEPELEHRLKAAVHGGHIRAVMTIADVVRASDVVFIVVPTPSLPSGEFSLEYVESVCQDIGETLAGTDGYRVIVISSTVMPGHMVMVRDVLQRTSGKQCSRDFGLCYNPEFIALGSVVRDFLHPDLVLIGESDARAGELLAQVYWSIGVRENVRRMSWESAEVTKLALNCIVTAKISWANWLAMLCDQIPRADVDAITGAIGLDSRIGVKYLRAGAPFGGPCFPRDNAALTTYAMRCSIGAEQAIATQTVNGVWRGYIMNAVVGLHPQSISILGLSYKIGSQVRDEAFGVWLQNECRNRQINIQPWMSADVIVLALPDESYISMLERDSTETQTILDLWRVLDPRRVKARVVTIGGGGRDG